MIPTEGFFHQWASTYAGQMGLILAWLIAGFIAAGALTGLVLVRAAPDITTQTDRITGVKKRGLVQWFGFWSLIFVGPGMILGIVLTGIAAVDWLNLHAPLWWVAGMLIAVCVGCVLVYRRFRVPRREYTHDEPAPAAEPEPVPQGWSLDPEMPQWDGR